MATLHIAWDPSVATGSRLAMVIICLLGVLYLVATKFFPGVAILMLLLVAAAFVYHRWTNTRAFEYMLTQLRVPLRSLERGSSPVGTRD